MVRNTKKHMNESVKEMAVDILNDILENILKQSLHNKNKYGIIIISKV